MSKRTRSGGAGGGGGGKRGGGATGQAPTGVTKRAKRGHAATAAAAAPPAPGAPTTRRRGSGLTQDVALHPSLFGLTDPDAVLRNARIAAPKGVRPATAARKPAVRKAATKKGSRATRATSAASAAQPTPAASIQPQPTQVAEEDEQDLDANPALDEVATVAGDKPMANHESTARAEREAADRGAAEKEADENEVDEGLRRATEVADLAKKLRAANERAEKERAEKEKAENEEMERVEKENAAKEKAEREKAEKARAEKEKLEKETAEKEKAEKERANEEAAAKEEAARKEAEEKAAQERVEKEREEKKYQDWLREQAAREDEEFRKQEELEEEEARKQEVLEEQEARKQESLQEKQSITMQEIIKEKKGYAALLEYERTKGYKRAGAGLKRAAESGPECEDASKKARVEDDLGPICNDKDSCDKFKQAIKLAKFKFDRTGSDPAVKMGQPLSLDIMFQGLAAVTEAINESRAAQNLSRLYGLFHPRSLVDESMLNHPATPKLYEAFVPIVRKAGAKTHHSLIVLFQTRPKSEHQSEFFEMHHYDSDPRMRGAFESTFSPKALVKQAIKKTGWAGRGNVDLDSFLGATKTKVVCDRPDGHEWAIGIHIILNGWVCALNLKHNPNALLGKTGFYEQAINLINFAVWGFIGSQVILDFFDCYEYTLPDDMDERVREHLRKGRSFKDSKDFPDYGKLDRHIGRMTGRIPARQAAQPQPQQEPKKPEPKTPTSAKPADVFPKGVFGDILGGMDTSAGYAAADEAPKPKPTGQGPTLSKADQKILDDAAAGRVNDENQDEEQRSERRKAKAEVRAKKAKVVDNDPDAAEVADVVQEYPASDYDDSNTDDEYMNDAEDDADGVPINPVFDSPPALEKVSKWAKHNEALAKTRAFQKQQPQPAQAREASVELEDPEPEDLFDADIDFDADIEYEADGEVETLFPGASVPSNSPPRPGPTSAPRPKLQPTVVDDPEEEDLYTSGDPLPNQAPEPRRPSLALPPRPPPPTPHDHAAFPDFTIPQPAVNLTLTNPEGTTYTPRVSASQVSPSAFVKAVVPRPIAVPNLSGTFAVPDTPSTSDESQKDREQAEATEEDEDLLQDPPRVLE